MLVLTRKVGERIHIGDGIVVTVVRIQNDKVRIGIEAPAEVAIHREEVYRRVLAAQAANHLTPKPSNVKAASEGHVSVPNGLG
jgi:carbon storage regulator